MVSTWHYQDPHSAATISLVHVVPLFLGSEGQRLISDTSSPGLHLSASIGGRPERARGQGNGGDTWCHWMVVEETLELK